MTAEAQDREGEVWDIFQYSKPSLKDQLENVTRISLNIWNIET